ncbi:MAG: helix-turn-helix transcriptional regulator [Terriglobales bacterium]
MDFDVALVSALSDYQSRKKPGIALVRVDWNAVGRRLRELRGFDVTQQEFARRIGVSQNYLSTMERGKVEIGAEILLRIGLEFGKSLEWLLTGEIGPR